MRVRLRFFASLREIAGKDELDVDVDPETTAGGLWEEVVDRYPRMSPYTRTLQVAVNQDFADKTRRLEPNDEIVFLPPVSGG